MMNRYMWEAIEMSLKLADIGNPIEDKLLAVVILAGFSFQYKPLVMALWFRSRNYDRTG